MRVFHRKVIPFCLGPCFRFILSFCTLFHSPSNGIYTQVFSGKNSSIVNLVLDFLLFLVGPLLQSLFVRSVSLVVHVSETPLLFEPHKSLSSLTHHTSSTPLPFIRYSNLFTSPQSSVTSFNIKSNPISCTTVYWELKVIVCYLCKWIVSTTSR